MTTHTQRQYQTYLRSPRWRLLRWLRKWMDGNRCRMCGTRSRLEVHHRDYTHRGKSFFGELMDTTTVCRNCHGDYHDGD